MTSRDDPQRGGNGSRNGQDGEQNERQGPPTAEKTITAISVAFTLLVFGYVAWHAVEPPDWSPPEVEVVGAERADDGSLLVHVQFRGSGDRGLASATVEADCAQPPPELTFEHVPAGGRERGTLVCPPGTTDPNVSVSSWEPA